MIHIPDRLTSDRIRLIAIDAERDGDLMARWSNDAGMMRLYDSDVPRPRIARQTRADTERWAYRDSALGWAIQLIPWGEGGAERRMREREGGIDKFALVIYVTLLVVLTIRIFRGVFRCCLAGSYS